MKKLYMLTLILIHAFIFAQTATPPSSGDGSSGNPYQIESLDNLFWVTQNSDQWYNYFIQTNDIDASDTFGWNSGEGFSPIGNTETYFTGNYNGQGFTIDSLYIRRAGSDFQGLFGYTINSEIKNLGVTNADISGNSFTGGLTGCSDFGSKVNNCYATGAVNCAGYYVGGLLGFNNEVSNSYAAVSVTGTGYVGGLVGYNHQSTVTNCYSTGSVSGNYDVGGLVGINNYSAVITNSYATGSVTGTGYYVGGLIGYTEGTSIITNCYSTGSVSGLSNVGGLVGRNLGSLVTASFWDIETSGNTTSPAGTGKTTAEMKTPATFTNAVWDFTTPVWKIVSGVTYPYLAWQPSANVVIVNSDNGVDGEYPAGFVLHLQPYVYPPGSGMAFINWTDGEDNILSEESLLAYTVTDNNITIYANFESGLGFSVLTISNDGANVILQWDNVPGADYYKVFSSVDPYGIFRLDETGTFDGTSWTAPFDGNKKFYYIVAYN
jgi:hypothetical protein